MHLFTVQVNNLCFNKEVSNDETRTWQRWPCIFHSPFAVCAGQGDEYVMYKHQLLFNVYNRNRHNSNVGLASWVTWTAHRTNKGYDINETQLHPITSYIVLCFPMTTYSINQHSKTIAERMLTMKSSKKMHVISSEFSNITLWTTKRSPCCLEKETKILIEHIW